METELDTNLYLSHDFNEMEKEFLRLTKEWLIQNRIDKNKSHGRGYIHWNNVIDDLLKEIQK